MPRFLPITVAITMTLVVAGCGSSGSGSGGGSYGGASAGGGYGDSKPAESDSAAIALRNGHLVDRQGRSLYLFEADRTRSSTCSGQCVQAWPPVVVTGEPRPVKGVRAGLLGTSTRGDGDTQVTYAGHPLYRYAGDQAAGDTNGQGLDQFGAEWYLVMANGGPSEEQ